MKKNTRTQKDETQYDEQLRRESTTKTEVIVELKTENTLLRQSLIRMLAGMIDAQDALRIFRVRAIDSLRAAEASKGDCVPGCTKHYWDTVDGWHSRQD